MSSHEIDIENESANIPSPQGDKEKDDEREDTNGKYPYIDKIIELSKTQKRYGNKKPHSIRKSWSDLCNLDRYEAQTNKWRDELKLYSNYVPPPRDTYTTTFDEFFGTGLMIKTCENQFCYEPWCKGCIELPICAIIDTYNETLSVQRFKNSEIEDEFCEALRVEPPNI